MGHVIGRPKFVAIEIMLEGDAGGSSESKIKYRVFLFLVENSIH
jgi:hypothetical protein